MNIDINKLIEGGELAILKGNGTKAIENAITFLKRHQKATTSFKINKKREYAAKILKGI